MLSRRTFIGQAGLYAGMGMGLVGDQSARAASSNDKVNIAVMGVRSRGKQLVAEYAGLSDVRVAAICDIDERQIPPAADIVKQQQGHLPRAESDIRRVLDDKSIDALVIAAPNHWHALATVWACQAGKDVYVEKPVSHNIVEGRRMVQAARKYERIVQVGTQRRSNDVLGAAAEYIHSGKLGKVGLARAWIVKQRRSIGRVADSAVPDGVDYDLWTGPAPERPFNANRFHYNWHWFWDYGGGELANNGVHILDMARRLLGVKHADAVSSSGTRLMFNDDGQTPDAQIVTYEFPETMLVWEHRQWSNFGIMGEKTRGQGVAVGLVCYGEKGTLVVSDFGWQVTQDGKVIETHECSEEGETTRHVRNFLDCVKSRRLPNADIEIGHQATVLCHIGNIAQRLGRKLRWEPGREQFANDDEANQLLSREYRQPFVLPAEV